ncbi:prolipoprotein diacylglyceryl transferase [Sulfurospirillum arcachonense]|uniref:prolipoprotein diacylglyceryl transferase n=1 Tax=Sulfurospirillum arcachonense TaxID=57666 RepID=UPI0004695600|nr:prolipoprotein diacylglyceryl transferase [Sulfurospirillum arcachonense]
MTFWNNIYNHFDPIAFDLGFISVHWYGIMYVLALLTALGAAKFFMKKDKMPITEAVLDNYFIWIEVGIILGARIGYILFYDTHTSYYLTHPWQMFNPFLDGTFVGIRGMSYHGAIIGFILATLLFKYRHKKTNIWELLDLVALSVPIGYIFGRLGNFLNQELVGRATDSSIGIYVDGVLRHPSQLYEAFLEGACVFLVLFLYRNKKRFSGELIALYGALYSMARFIAEFYRQPDFQMGFVYGGWMSMGQALSLLMIVTAIILYIYLQKNANKIK